MPRTEAANQRLREAQREKILDAARKVFARKGMDATMGEVAAEASISQGLAYHYFASKDALFQALSQQVLQASTAGLQHVLAMPGTPGERITLLVSRVVESRREHPDIYQLMDQIQSDETTPANLHEHIQRQGQAFYDVLRQLIVEGQATGEVATGDPDQLVIAMVACVVGLSRLSLRNQEQFTRSCPDADILLRMLLVPKTEGSRAPDAHHFGASCSTYALITQPC
ncbi:TetR/AcrR family transcriptional regulator [Dictyobacter kobayashii]|uniref:HTH tetR-type domain-containing protein n=1 Tax=Dictyobacter kobayashii TaxID=2014872 RepID=A0A402AQT0_9CHLR|nr:TetR/AcrR family transcriptional regulator [Dictyobacter kobayashii]GCE21450.1 hypothetical protein KDK_52500 [Dictyobacter kobayashii]